MSETQLARLRNLGNMLDEARRAVKTQCECTGQSELETTLMLCRCLVEAILAREVVQIAYQVIDSTF
jgi:hypothetical protein